MQKLIQNWEKGDLTNFGNIVELSVEFREGIETLRTTFRIHHECFIFYYFSLIFVVVVFCGISRKTLILICYDFLCFTTWLAHAK